MKGPRPGNPSKTRMSVGASVAVVLRICLHLLMSALSMNYYHSASVALQWSSLHVINLSTDFEVFDLKDWGFRL